MWVHLDVHDGRDVVVPQRDALHDTWIGICQVLNHLHDIVHDLLWVWIVVELSGGDRGISTDQIIQVVNIQCRIYGIVIQHRVGHTGILGVFQEELVQFPSRFVIHEVVPFQRQGGHTRRTQLKYEGGNSTTNVVANSVGVDLHTVALDTPTLVVGSFVGHSP
jgi:hypothetical protein